MKNVNTKHSGGPLKLKPLGAALAVAMGATFAIPAVHAVNIAEDGLGEVLIFPYYTVRNGFDTNINITNTSDKTVAFKIRFREGENSRDARDFNVVLSPRDVWNGTVTLAPNGEVARFRTADTSCTAPQLPIDLGNGVRAVDFTNLDYTGPQNDFGSQGLDRTKEGYIEIIQMGHASAGAENSETAFNGVPFNAKHVQGVPRDCGAVRTAFTPAAQGGTLPETVRTFLEPVNVLKGTASLIDAGSGKGMSFEPVVLANFFNPAGTDGAGAPGENLIRDPASVEPNLASASPPVAQIHSDTIASSPWGLFSGRSDAVSALLSRTSVINQFSVNPANNALTDWVVTFPTKKFYVDQRETSAVRQPFAADPASSLFQVSAPGESCVTVGFDIWDREEFSPDTPDDLQFSPPPPPGEASTICYETNVITFNGGNLLGSALAKNVSTPADFNIPSGWMELTFPAAGDLVSDTGPWLGVTGLPVIGMALTTLENGVAGDNLLNYGLAFEHAYTRSVSVVNGESLRGQ